jgi:DNA-binding MarR family transcriptional regulator
MKLQLAEKSGILETRHCNISARYRFTSALRAMGRRRAAMSEVSLTGWMKALIAYVRSGEPDLTNRQMALLMLVYLTPGPHTVRGLARVLGVSKPVVTRALNTLGALGYLRRERDQDDRRNVFVVRTSSGAEFLEGFKRNLREGDSGSAAHRPIIGQAPAYAHQR